MRQSRIDYEVRTALGRAVQTFDDKKRALAFAKFNVCHFGQLEVVSVERIVESRRVKMVRYSAPVCPVDNDVSIPGVPA